MRPQTWLHYQLRALRAAGSVLWAVLRAVVGRLLALLSPPRCSACDRRLPREAVFCVPCAATVLRAGESQGAAQPSATRVVASALYGGALADAIRHFKYADRPDLARPLGDLARQAAQRAGLRADLVVPVPLHCGRLAERGFNQAALIARAVAPQVSGRNSPRMLQRVRATAPQASLRRRDRAANVADAFRVRLPGQLCGRHVLLVDDVMTTGATLSSCATALQDAGASKVEALVVARAVPDERGACCSKRAATAPLESPRSPPDTRHQRWHRQTAKTAPATGPPE